MLVPSTISGAFSSTIENMSNISEVAETVVSIFSALVGGSVIGAWVLMIIARVKYKESKFAKVLMWVYIGFFAAGLIAVALFIAMCWYITKDCQGF